MLQLLQIYPVFMHKDGQLLTQQEHWPKLHHFGVAGPAFL